MAERLKKHFTLLVVFIPILMMYKVGPLPLVTWMMLFWIVEYLLFCIKVPSGRKCKVTSALLVFFFYSFIVAILQMLKSDAVLIDFNAFLNYHFWLWIAIFWAKDWFDIEKGYIWLKEISIFSTIYIYLQSILYKTAGYVLSGFIPFLQTDYVESAEKVLQGVAYRPTSVFAEPAGYGIFIALFVLLYINVEKNMSVPFLFFLGFGVALSQSSAGLMSIAYVLLTNYFAKIRRGKIRRSYMLFAIAIVVGAFILYQMGYVDLVINHLFDSQNGHIIMAAGLTQRIGDYGAAWESLNDLNQKLFGVGFLKNQFSFLPGSIKLVYFYGVIGTLIFMILHICLYNKVSYLGKKITLFVLALSFFANTILGVQPIIYYPLIIAAGNLERREIYAGGERLR